MFNQLLTPVADSLGLSFLVAILPIVTLLVLLGLLRRHGWEAAQHRCGSRSTRRCVIFSARQSRA